MSFLKLEISFIFCKFGGNVKIPYKFNHFYVHPHIKGSLYSLEYHLVITFKFYSNFEENSPK